MKNLKLKHYTVLLAGMVAGMLSGLLTHFFIIN